MIRKPILPAVILICISHLLYGQQDTISHTHSYLLNEVKIYAPSNLNQADRKTVQQSTENILQNIPGATLIRRGNFAPEPILHGLSGGDINVTIDGIKMFGACTDKMDPVSSYVEPNNLESVHAIFSPGNEDQGANIGGGIDFRLKQPETGATRRWSGLAGAQYGTNGNAVQTLANLQYSTQNFALLVNGLYRESQDYTAGNHSTINFSQYHKWNGNIAAKYKVNNHNYLLANYLRDEGYNIGYPALLMDVKYAKANLGSFTWNYQNAHSRLYKATTKLYVNNIDHAMDDTKRPEWQVPVHMDMPGTSKTLGGYSEAYFRLNQNNTLKAKAEFYQNSRHAEMTMYPDNSSPMFMLTIPDAQRSSYNLSASDNIAISPKWNLNFGGRLALNHSIIVTEMGKQQISSVYQSAPDRNHILWNAFADINWQISNRLSVGGNIAHGMRDATLPEYYSIYIFNRIDNYDYIGNPGLKSERSFNAALRVDYVNPFVSLSGNTYCYKIKNYIAGKVAPKDYPMTYGATGVKQYTNLPSAILYGISLNLKFRLLTNLNIHSRNNLAYGNDVNRNALPLIAPFESVNTLEFSFRKFTSEIESVSNAAQNHVSDYYGEQPSPAFSIFNFRISRTFPRDKNKLACSFSVNNILNKNYYEHLDVFDLPRPGRSFIGTVTLMF